jgi:hypothetical protein
MNGRLNRIQGLVLSLTTLMTLVALASGLTTPLGIVFGGMAAWLDFVVIKGLGAAALVAHSPAKAHIVPLAVAKSFVLVSVPAIALFLPGTVVSGMSFAIGVTALPAAIILDACLAIPRGKAGEV